MGYKKFIAYGNNFELYEYEKEIAFSGRQGVPKGRSNSQNMGHDESTLGKPIFDQGRRKDNAERARSAFARLVIANLSGKENPLFVTFTYARNQKSLDIGYADFNYCIKNLRKAYGKVFSYIAVPEFQRRGAVHFHTLFWSLPSTQLLQERQSYNLSPELSKHWRYGFVYLKATDGNEKLGYYLSKYMAKAFQDKNLSGHKSYVCSRNVLRPIVGSGFENSAFVLDAWGVDNYPFKTSQYMTQYLGQAKKSIYYITN